MQLSEFKVTDITLAFFMRFLVRKVAQCVNVCFDIYFLLILDFVVILY